MRPHPTTASVRQAGFSLVEAMVVISILAILAAIGTPAMTDLLRTQKIRATSYDIFADLTYARSEAISRGRNVEMRSASGGNDWVGGWTIVDLADPANPLRTEGARSAGILFTADSDRVTFDRTGRTTAGVISFTITPVDLSAPDSQKRCVRIDPSGRARSTEGVCL